ncbi:MAG: hypothetical protein RI953_2452 [Pseudomonadota bacterium]|jgi:hypothetical protein
MENENNKMESDSLQKKIIASKESLTLEDVAIQVNKIQEKGLYTEDYNASTGMGGRFIPGHSTSNARVKIGIFVLVLVLICTGLLFIR